MKHAHMNVLTHPAEAVVLNISLPRVFEAKVLSPTYLLANK